MEADRQTLIKNTLLQIELLSFLVLLKRKHIIKKIEVASNGKMRREEGKHSKQRKYPHESAKKRGSV